MEYFVAGKKCAPYIWTETVILDADGVILIVIEVSRI